MMRILKAEEIAKVDNDTITNLGIPAIVLMENAGRSATEIILKKYSNTKRFIIICGSGNNGGDGLVIARYLHLLKRNVSVYILANDPNLLSKELHSNLGIYQKINGHVDFVYDLNTPNFLDQLLPEDIIIDAIFGTGFKSPARGTKAFVIEALSKLTNKIVSIDIPSGMSADDGISSQGSFIKADTTICFAYLKPCHILSSSYIHCGEVYINNISLNDVYCNHINRFLITKDSLTLPTRPIDTHKYKLGHTLIIGGSAGMSGSVILSSKASMASGSGVCSAILPSTIIGAFETNSLESMSIPCPFSEAQFTKESNPFIIDTALKGKFSSILIGPGMKQSKDIQELLIKLLKIDLPIVIDADGLNNLSDIRDYKFLLKQRTTGTILTPHIGEASRLLNIDSKEIQNNMEKHAISLALDTNSIVILKSSRTVIATPDGSVYYSISGNPGMATAGSGDVLAGIVLSYASRLTLIEASILGVFLHGHAGDLAASSLGQESMVAHDIIDFIPKAYHILAQSKTSSISDSLIIKLNEL